MTKLEMLLRVSVARAELLRLAREFDSPNARVLTYAANILALVEPDAFPIIKGRSASAS
jgi:hypothetical protein